MKDSTELIPIASSTIGGAAIQTVNARDLHAFLGVGKKFASWIVDRIEQFGFIEGVDFIVIPDSGKNSDGRPKKEYAVSISNSRSRRPTRKRCASLPIWPTRTLSSSRKLRRMRPKWNSPRT